MTLFRLLLSAYIPFCERRHQRECDHSLRYTVLMQFASVTQFWADTEWLRNMEPH